VNDDADLPLWRVGTVVFSSVRATDYTGACHIAERAVAQGLGEHRGPQEILMRGHGGSLWRARVVQVLDLGMATGNGYVYLLPATKAWRMYEGTGESGGLPEGIIRSFNPEEDRD